MLFLTIIFLFFISFSISKEKSDVYTNYLSKVNYKYKRNTNPVRRVGWKFPLKYYVRLGVNRTVIRLALKRFEESTCLQFIQVESIPKNEQGLLFISDNYCSSFVGNKVGDNFQEIKVGGICKTDIGKMQQTIGYALGMINQQTRPDRDEYIQINLNNVGDLYKENFKIANLSTKALYGMSYDFASMMQLGVYALSRNGQPTTEAKISQYNGMIGQSVDFSFNDYKLLNLHYCSHICTVRVNCLYGGYQDRKSCEKCKCPYGLAGPTCKKIQQSDRKCGTTELTASLEFQDLEIKGVANCTFRITTEVFKRIKLMIANVKTKDSKPCLENNGFEIKYRNDKGAAGLRLCGDYKNIRLESEGNFIIVTYIGQYSVNLMNIKYRATVKNFYKS